MAFAGLRKCFACRLATSERALLMPQSSLPVDAVELPILLQQNHHPVRHFSATPMRAELRKLAQMRVVDNSKIGMEAMALRKPPKIIHVYNKREVGTIGDKVMVTILGEKKRGYIVGVRKQQWLHGVPRYDTNNLVLIDENGNPLGTRITAPFPMMLRGNKKGDFSKFIAIAKDFV